MKWKGVNRKKALSVGSIFTHSRGFRSCLIKTVQEKSYFCNNSVDRFNIGRWQKRIAKKKSTLCAFHVRSCAIPNDGWAAPRAGYLPPPYRCPPPAVGPPPAPLGCLHLVGLFDFTYPPPFDGKMGQMHRGCRPSSSAVRLNFSPSPEVGLLACSAEPGPRANGMGGGKGERARQGPPCRQPDSGRGESAVPRVGANLIWN